MNAVIIDAKDDVAVAIEPIAAGEMITFSMPDGTFMEIPALEDIIIYHKAAIRDMEPGHKVTKYGEHIGEAACFIKKGQHVHVHNIKEVRENLDEA